MTTVGQETALLKSYVDIMQMRFGSSFQYYNVIPTELFYHEIPAFTMQPIVENAILHGVKGVTAGGIMLLIFKPFQVGDYIIIAQQNGCEGTVYKIEICYTTLISIDNKHIVIPNGTLSGSIITNVTARDLRKLEIKV